MSLSPTGRRETLADDIYDDEDIYGMKEPTELRELLRDGESAMQEVDEPIVTGITSRRFNLWWKRRRRRSTRSPLRPVRVPSTWYRFQCAGFRIFRRVLKVLFIFFLGVVATM